jgi:hypothetical protein
MARSLHGRAGDLSATLADAGPLATNAQTVVDVLDEQRPALQQLIANSGDILAAAGGRARPLRAAVTAGDRLLDVTARRNRELGATIDALPPFLHQLQTTATTLGGFSSDLNAATTALEPVAPQLLPTFASVQTAAPVFRSLFARLPGVIAAGRRGLPAVGHILRVLPSSLRDIDGLARELIPFLDLLGASRRSVVGTFANVGQIQNGSMIGPGGKVIHYGNGLPTIWNETLGGWVKRLPSNRQNPYPKPNSALDIARGGLKAYDCRNTGNENYLAPTGSGAPPCLTQGPWEFRGETRTFPHLTLRPR